MKTRVRLLVFALSLISLTANAQSVADGIAGIRDTIIKKQRYLRGFSADPQVNLQWNDGSLESPPPVARTLAAVVTKSVEVSNQKIEIKADRLALFIDEHQRPTLIQMKEPVRITVDLTGADMATVLPHLVDMIFYRDLNDALSELPSAYKDSLPQHVDPKPLSLDKPVPHGCDCADATANKCSAPANLKTDGMTAPKLIYSVDPDFGAATRNNTFNNSVQTAVEVDKSGKVVDVWIVRPAGIGMDVPAAAALRQYRFNPATCHGQPTTSYIYIDMNAGFYY